MTAVRVNRDMKKRVNIDIDAESSNFDCKVFGIKYHERAADLEDSDSELERVEEPRKDGSNF